MTKNNQEDQDIPSWWKLKPGPDTKNVWKDVVANYIEIKDIDVD